MTELVLLAVTKMRSGVCIGGVRRDSPGDPPAWIRPVKPFGPLLPGDIRYADGTLMRPWDIVALALGRSRPVPPHLEDVEADLVHHRPELRGRLDEPERRQLLERMVDPNPMELLRARQRSLTVFRPTALTAAFSLDTYSGRYDARLWWPGCGRPDGLPVTDLKWRALGRRLTTEGEPQQQLDEAALRELLGYQDLFVAAGLSRAFLGEHWPLVVAVHAVPDYDATVDERHL